MDTHKFFDEDETPTPEQKEAAEEIQLAIDKVANKGIGWGKTWLLNRAARYLDRVDTRTEPLED